LRELHNEGKDKRDNGNMFQLDFDEDEAQETEQCHSPKTVASFIWQESYFS
jgi:hypothetical protein